MPASRSRTHEWKRLLQQIAERGGAIEIAVAHPDHEADEPDAHAAGPDLVWRVKILDLGEDEIVVESPMALGRDIHIEAGTELAAAITVGQNRWTFRTVNLGDKSGMKSHGHPGLRLRMPVGVARSQRRRLRVDTQALKLPRVELWPLLDPKSVLPAERATELAYESWVSGEQIDRDGLLAEAMLPTVGPKFTAELANLGGGGVGLIVGPEDSGILGRHRVLWLRLALEPEMPVPMNATGKVVHTHIDSTQKTYVGIAFDFSFNPGHQKLVGDQIQHYIEQKQDLQRQAREHRENADSEG
ncbi:MAG: hypothetical protein CMJ34_01965 [Phycisphaerae bacterium]|nr:hypothetical protein [Phycisphaerae bacterium]